MNNKTFKGPKYKFFFKLLLLTSLLSLLHHRWFHPPPSPSPLSTIVFSSSFFFPPPPYSSSPSSLPLFNGIEWPWPTKIHSKPSHLATTPPPCNLRKYYKSMPYKKDIFQGFLNCKYNGGNSKHYRWKISIHCPNSRLLRKEEFRVRATVTSV